MKTETRDAVIGLVAGLAIIVALKTFLAPKVSDLIRQIEVIAVTTVVVPFVIYEAAKLSAHLRKGQRLHFPFEPVLITAVVLLSSVILLLVHEIQ